MKWPLAGTLCLNWRVCGGINSFVSSLFRYSARPPALSAPSPRLAGYAYPHVLLALQMLFSGIAKQAKAIEGHILSVLQSFVVSPQLVEVLFQAYLDPMSGTGTPAGIRRA